MVSLFFSHFFNTPDLMGILKRRHQFVDNPDQNDPAKK